jgi:hypothetical protein
MRLFAVAGGFPTAFVGVKNSQLMQCCKCGITSFSVNHATPQPQLFTGRHRYAGVLSPNS